ncbi:MAG TPA: hypothetical protein ENG11_01965 [candidate division Zixibacteria bacterium]|nr:hypothetical protein [candidate division Zixibacteria bacterium]
MSEGGKKFIADVMLGRLARWLRLFGYDTVYSSAAQDNEILVEALISRRVLLTRDVELAKTAGAVAYLVRANDLWGQLREVVAHFGLETRVKLAICPVCNGKIVPVRKQEIEGKVPRYTYLTHERFWRCENCGKIYWRGSHISLAEKDIKKFLGGADENFSDSSLGQSDN